MKCPACGAENPDSAEFCNLCFESLGFENIEYTEPAPLEGYRENYPSSFNGEADLLEQPEVGVRPGPEPVDIGQYGVRSGAPYETGAPSPMPPPGVYQQVESPARAFDWGKALLNCVYIAMTAAAMSVVLELFFSFIGVGMLTTGRITSGLVVVFLALLIPVAFAGFASGYRAEGYGWAVGLISVGLWAFIFRPLYFAILAWLLTERFEFTAVFSRYSIAFIFGLFLPVGAFLGWLGEKRATTGLYF